MTPELMEEAVVDLAILAGYLLVLGVGCLIADFVFPHIPLIERYLECLPDWEDEDERSESMSSIKVTMDVQTLRSIMGDTFDYDAFSQGRKDCYKLAMKSSYDEFAAKLEEVKKYIEYESHHHVAPGPSYWLGCLCQFGDSTVWPEKEVRGDE